MSSQGIERRAFEARIVEIVQCLAGLCDTEIGVHTDPEQLASIDNDDEACILSYEVNPEPKYFRFDFDLIPIEAAFLKRKEYDHYSSRVGLRIHLPEAIEQILRRYFGSNLFEGVQYALNGRADLEFELVHNELMVSFLRIDFDNFTVDCMTDTMLRHAYSEIVNALEPVMPWLRFARFLSEQYYMHEQLERIQKLLPEILENALLNPSVADAHVFTLCELSGSFEPAMRLFKKRYGDLFLESLD